MKPLNLHRKTTHNLKGCKCPKGSLLQFCLGLPKEKKVKGYGILLYHPKEHKPFLFGVFEKKYETSELYKKNGLYKPYYNIIPVEITYKLK